MNPLSPAEFVVLYWRMLEAGGHTAFLGNARNEYARYLKDPDNYPWVNVTAIGMRVMAEGYPASECRYLTVNNWVARKE